MKIGIVAKNDEKAINISKKLIKFLNNKKIGYYIEKKIAERLGEKGKEIKEMEVDYIIALGGDGTILRTVHYTGGKIPILGINFGTRGFLTEVEPTDWKSAIERVIDGKFKIEMRDKLEVVSKEKLGEVLNEVALVSSLPVQMLHLEILIDGFSIGKLKADGIIVSTPTGSTAYCVSAGGPYVHPDVNAFIVTPICVFDGIRRAIVVPNKSEVEIKVICGESPVAVLDGKHIFEVKDNIKVRLSKNKAKFIKLGRNFYEKIRKVDS